MARNGFWLLAVLWLPAGVAAQTGERFLPETGAAPEPGVWVISAVMAISSLVRLAPCGLPLSLGCRRLWRPALPARGVVCWDWPERCNSCSVGGGRVARSGRDRHLRGGAQPAGVGRVVVAGAARLAAAEVGPATQQGG